MKIIDEKYDERSGCFSILSSMTLREYKDIAFNAFENSGNIPGQRDVIKKSSAAAKIRRRMNADFVNGALFPSVVLGLNVSVEEMEKISSIDSLHEIINDSESVSIIDGMQRSGVYFANYEGNEERETC